MRLRLSNTQARRLVLSGAGLHGPRGRTAADADSVHETVRQLGFVQLDSLQVVERAHHHILLARQPAYHPELLRTVFQEQRRLFEHWTHDASLIPMEFFPHWRHRYERARQRIAASRWWQERLQGGKSVEAVRLHVERQGPTRARDLEKPGEKPAPRGPWWGWSTLKAALEYLWFTGELAVVGRDRFEKIYDLTERVIPAAARRPRPARATSLDWACQGALDRLGLASVAELASFWDLFDRADVTGWARRGLAAGRLVEVEWLPADGGPARRALASAELPDRLSGSRASELPAASRSSTLRALAPFDPLVRDRQRAQRLFGFDYRIEIYTPRADRRFGYYVFPLLEGDRFVGRIDLKADRAADCLRVLGLWPEPGVQMGPARRARLEAELARLARLAGVQDVQHNL